MWSMYFTYLYKDRTMRPVAIILREDEGKEDQ
jgi:hypothetical protein